MGLRHMAGHPCSLLTKVLSHWICGRAKAKVRSLSDEDGGHQSYLLSPEGPKSASLSQESPSHQAWDERREADKWRACQAPGCSIDDEISG